MATTTPSDFKVRGVTLELTTPEQHHLRKIVHRARQTNQEPEKITYQVVLHTRAALFGKSRGYQLLIGDKRIPAYEGDKDGLRFMLYSYQDLLNLAGGRIKFAMDGNHPMDTGGNFPDFSKIQRQVGRRFQVRLP
jgi:hypothetical protein